MADDDKKKKKHTRPSPPGDVKVDGQSSTTEVTTKQMHEVKISAKIDDPTPGQPVKLKVEYTPNNWATTKVVASDFGKQARRETVVLPNLKANTLYKAKLWTVAKKAGPDQVSKQYTGVSFWTNRKAVVTLVTPVENSEYEEFIPGSNPPQPTMILFDWTFEDPDSPDTTDQAAYQIRYRTKTGNWIYIPRTGAQTGKTGQNTFQQYAATHLVANTTYLWTARGRDKQGIWADWPLPVSFFVRGASSPPTLVAPLGGRGGAAQIASNTIRFSWKFRDPDPKNKQTQADIRWRVVGTGDVGGVGDEGWFVHFGEDDIPGKVMQWDIEPGHFAPGFLYEWQVRTYDDKNSGIPSGWSESGQFVAAVAPGSGIVEPPLSEDVDPLNELGCGHHRAFIYDRGGQILRGEIKPLARVLWGRKRDDIASAIIDTNGFDQDCCELLGAVQSWRHELVIFRDGTRVFEGPITRITYTSVSVEIEAKDVMAYLYRRVMREGYNDAYRRIDLTPKTKPTSGAKGGPYTIVGQNTVVDRALQITLNALAYQDPNVLPYVTAIHFADDTIQNRIVHDYSRTAWEEIDDLAATAGLDYVTVGRRIIYWDTNRAIGRLPEMRDGDFSDPVIVTEYGMELANWYAVTNNNGVAGIAYPSKLPKGVDWWDGYGPVEMVSSAYSEKEGAVVSTQSLTPAAKDALEASLRKNAKSGISDRWPTPVVVRVPDNSTLNPQVNLNINQLIPGVWIPLRATLTCRKFAQWQKLDSVDVEEINGQEMIRVIMSPAPHDGDDDPDKFGDQAV